MKRQAQPLELTRSHVYYQPRPVSERDLKLMRRIDELHLEAPFYGARKLAAQLRREGHEIGRKHVRTLMRLMGIEALYRKPRTSIPARGAENQPNELLEQQRNERLDTRATQATIGADPSLETVGAVDRATNSRR